MRKYIYLAIAAICLGVSACGDDEELTIEENTTDLAVTGSVQEVYLEEDYYSSVSFSAEIIGYLNLTDEIRLSVGMSPTFGIEVSTNSSFPLSETKQYSTQRMDDNRKFTIKATSLNENTTYYYRTFLTNTIFGNIKTFTTESYEAAVAKMTTTTADVTNVMENSASVNLNYKNTGVAYATDKSLLTAANVKKATQDNDVNGLNLTDGNLAELASGTTYYYCEYRKLGTYIILGEVKSFKTAGYNVEDLAKQITVNANLNTNTQMWMVNIQSSIANSLQGKNISYDISVMMRSSYSSYNYDKIEVGWIWPDDRGKVNATGNANSYQATLENPYYNETIGIDEYGREHSLENWYDQWWEQTDENSDFWQNVVVAREYGAYIEANIAGEIEKMAYENCIGKIQRLFDRRAPQYADYVKCYLQVFVEIDGVRYVVKEVEGKVRVPKFEDNPLFNLIIFTKE